MTHLEVIELSARILAMYHSGILKMNCASCPNPEKYNCNLSCDVHVPVYYHPELGDLYTCPVNMMPAYIFDWYDEYLHNKEFGVCDRYDDRPFFQWRFEKAYITALNQLEVAKIKGKYKDGGDGDRKAGLGQFRKIASRKKE